MEHASNVADVRTALQTLHQQHEVIVKQLDYCINSHDNITRQLGRLDYSRARLGSLAHNARGISNGLLSNPASTAGRISKSVERLDLEQARVKATLKVVEQVAELKACVLGVMGSMGAPQDWETAAEYVHRASQISRDVITSGFAEEIVPTAEVPDAPVVTLDAAAQSLCRLFLREFEKAAEEGNGAGITRFFKMFPLIGRSKEGLDAYGKYVCQGVALRARARLQSGPQGSKRNEGFFYASALTKLFEHIAQVVEGHSALVEQHYGTGTMVKVMERLHREADIQGGIILDSWNDERSIDRKLTDVKSYAFSFLVQSFLPIQKSATSTPTRSQSPANKGSNTPSSTNKAQGDDGIDMKDVDQVLSEIESMLRHWSLYLRFVSSRASETNDGVGDDNMELTAPAFVAQSTLPTKINKILIQPFNTFVTFFLRRSVEKAFQLDENPQGLSLNLAKKLPSSSNPPYISSVVDDVMYVVNQVLQRALPTSQSTIVTSTVATVGRVLGSDFIGMIQRKMRDESYPKANIQGAAPPDEKVVSFLVLINNLDVATHYIKRIVETQTRSGVDQPSTSHKVSGSLGELFPMGRDAQSVRSSLQGLQTGFSSKAGELINDGLSVVFQQVIKPRTRPLIIDAFRDVDYAITSGEAADIQDDQDGSENESFRSKVRNGWEQLMKPITRILSQQNSEKILTTTTSYMGGILEKRIWSYHGRISDFGAVRLERDVSDIANIAVSGEFFKLRESFTRCLEIVTLMNMEDEEWEAVEALSKEEAVEHGWKLNDSERIRARGMIKGR